MSIERARCEVHPRVATGRHSVEVRLVCRDDSDCLWRRVTRHLMEFCRCILSVYLGVSSVQDRHALLDIAINSLLPPVMNVER